MIRMQKGVDIFAKRGNSWRQEVAFVREKSVTLVVWL